MNPQTLRDHLQRQPFEPFRVILSNGESFEIRHPEMAMILQNNLLVGFQFSQEGFPERYQVLSLLHVAHLEPIQRVT